LKKCAFDYELQNDLTCLTNTYTNFVKQNGYEKRLNKMYLSNLKEKIFDRSLSEISDDKKLITCLNAHSFNVAQDDKFFQYALQNSDIILPDGIAIVYAIRYLHGIKLKKISGYNLFYYEMEQLNKKHGSCFFLGSCESTNCHIELLAANEFPNIRTGSYSPPFKEEFSEEDSRRMLNEINAFNPDVLFIGMTAPKQEKWAATYFNDLHARHICCIGAVFDFYARNILRAPGWMIYLGFEWLHRFLSEPRRLWRRYLIGNPKFVAKILLEKWLINRKPPLKNHPVTSKELSHRVIQN